MDSGGLPHPRGCTTQSRGFCPPTFPADLQWTRADHGLARRGELRGQLVREGQVSVTREAGGHCLGVLGWCGGRRSLVASDMILGSKIRNKPPEKKKIFFKEISLRVLLTFTGWDTNVLVTF